MRACFPKFMHRIEIPRATSVSKFMRRLEIPRAVSVMDLNKLASAVAAREINGSGE